MTIDTSKMTVEEKKDLLEKCLNDDSLVSVKELNMMFGKISKGTWHDLKKSNNINPYCVFNMGGYRGKYSFYDKKKSIDMLNRHYGGLKYLQLSENKNLITRQELLTAWGKSYSMVVYFLKKNNIKPLHKCSNIHSKSNRPMDFYSRAECEAAQPFINQPSESEKEPMQLIENKQVDSDNEEPDFIPAENIDAYTADQILQIFNQEHIRFTNNLQDRLIQSNDKHINQLIDMLTGGQQEIVLSDSELKELIAECKKEQEIDLFHNLWPNIEPNINNNIEVKYSCIEDEIKATCNSNNITRDIIEKWGFISTRMICEKVNKYHGWVKKQNIEPDKVIHLGYNNVFLWKKESLQKFIDLCSDKVSEMVPSESELKEFVELCRRDNQIIDDDDFIINGFFVSKYFLFHELRSRPVTINMCDHLRRMFDYILEKYKILSYKEASQTLECLRRLIYASDRSVDAVKKQWYGRHIVYKANGLIGEQPKTQINNWSDDMSLYDRIERYKKVVKNNNIDRPIWNEFIKNIDKIKREYDLRKDVFLKGWSEAVKKKGKAATREDLCAILEYNKGFKNNLQTCVLHHDALQNDELIYVGPWGEYDTIPSSISIDKEFEIKQMEKYQSHQKNTKSKIQQQITKIESELQTLKKMLAELE